MATTAELTDDVEELREQVADLRTELAGVRTELELLRQVAKWVGLGGLAVIVIQTVAIVVLAGRVLSVEASKDGLTVGGGQHHAVTGASLDGPAGMSASPPQ